MLKGVLECYPESGESHNFFFKNLLSLILNTFINMYGLQGFFFFFFWRGFQPMTSAHEDRFLSLDQDINWFLV